MNKRIPLFALILGAAGAASVAMAQDAPPERRGPPPEALEACAELSAGDACTVDGPRGTAEGTCEAPPDRSDAELACRPDDMGPPPEAPEE